MVAVCLLGVTVVGGVAAAAGDRYWVGGGAVPPNGNFGTATHWTPAEVPDGDDNAVFNQSYTYFVNFAYNPTNSQLRCEAGEVSFYSGGAKRLYTLTDDALIAGSTLQLNDVDLTVTDELKVDGGSLNVGADTFGASVATCYSSTVGVAGTGQMSIYNGGRVVSARYGWVGRGAGSNGTVTVDGAGSLWDNDGDLRVGEDGTGRVNITNGGAVTSVLGYVGINASGDGTVSVQGDGSSWVNLGSVYIGGGSVNPGGVAELSIAGGTADLGSVRLWSGGTITLTSGTLRTRRFDNAAGGTLAFTGGTLIAEGTNAFNPGPGNFFLEGAGNPALKLITGTSATVAGNVTVAVDTAGTLELQAGGILNNSIGYIGNHVTAQGAVTVDGPGSSWTNTSLLYVGRSGAGTLTVRGGGTVANTTGFVGGSATGVGEVTVEGVDSVWTNSTSLYVGSTGDGSLTIRDWGSVTNTFGFIAATTADSRGAVVVEDFGSTWYNNNELHVGEAGEGTLTVRGGAGVTNTAAYLGFLSGSSGTATVTGNASTWNSGGDLYVGYGGGGELTVADGGYVTNAAAYLGHSSSGEGKVTVTGADTRWAGSGHLYVGEAGIGTLEVRDGAEVSSGSASVGYSEGSRGAVTVTGAGSRWNVGNWRLRIGEQGIGSVRIEDGGLISLQEAQGGRTCQLGIGSDAHGTMVVEGVGSTLDAIFYDLGVLGSASLEIRDGGTVSTWRTCIGLFGDRADGVAVVEGAGSSLNSDDFFVGGYEVADGGTGRVEARTGATVNVRDILKIWPGGVVNVDGGVLGFDRLEMAGGELNFNHGTVAIGTAVTVNGTGPVSHVLGPTLTIPADKSLESAGPMTLLTPVTLDGGSLAVGELVNPVMLRFNSGRLHIRPAGLTIGGSGLGTDVLIDASKSLSVAGTVTVEPGATLAIEGGEFAAGAVDNFGGLYLASHAASVTGKLINQPAGRVFVGPGRWANVGGAIENSGRLELMGNGARLTGAPGGFNAGLITGDGEIAAGLTNHAGGEIRVASGRRLLIDGANGANHGRISLLGGTVEFTQPLMNDPDGNILGRGTFIAGGGVRNFGDVALSGQATDIFGDVVNESGGRITISGQAAVTFWDDVQNQGALFKVAADSTATFFGEFSGEGISGAGHVYFEDDVSPGGSVGLMAFGGDVSFGGSAVAFIELAGHSDSQCDRFTVAGDLALNGNLLVEAIEPFTPSLGQQFTIFDTAGGLTGQFVGLGEGDLVGNFSGVDLFLTYHGHQGSDVVLYTPNPALPGDTNGSGWTDDDDLAILLANWEQDPAALSDWSLGDFTDDTNVDDDDLSVLLGNWTGPPSPGAAAVPEPATLALLALGGLAVIRRRRR